MEFTAVHSSRPERRVSSTASQIIDLFQTRNAAAELLSGFLGFLTQREGIDETLCQPPDWNSWFRREERGRWCCSSLSDTCSVAGSAVHTRKHWEGSSLLLGGICWNNFGISTQKGPPVTFLCHSKPVDLALCRRLSSAPQTKPLAMSPLALAPFGLLYLSSTGCNFSFQLWRKPSALQRVPLAVRASLRSVVAEAMGQCLGTVTQISTGVWSPCSPVAWPQPMPRHGCSRQSSWVLFLRPLLPVLEHVLAARKRTSSTGQQDI